MTERTPFEQSVASWLVSDAPGTVPADVIEGALERVADRGQDRYVTQRLFGDVLGRSPILRWSIVLALVAAALAGSVAVLGERVAPPRPSGIGAFGEGPLLAIGRESHTATLLSDGRVLVLGGRTHPDVWVPAADSTELWDPDSGDDSAFVRGKPLREPRSQHTATLLPDGRVLVVGGLWWSTGEALVRSSAEVWDPVTETFSPAGVLGRGRYEHTATLLPDGRVLIAGGGAGWDPNASPITTLEVWDPTTSTFSAAGELRTVRSAHAALLLADGRVLFVGETDSEVWDPATGSVVPGPSLVEPRYFHTATLLRDGGVLVNGGMWGSDADIALRDSAEIWHPGTSSFVPLEAHPRPRSAHTATMLLDGRILLVGGDDAHTAEVWDPGTGAFLPTGQTIEARTGQSATLLTDGRVLVIGTMSRRGIPRLTEIWDPAGQPLPTTREPTPEPPSTPAPVKVGG